MQPLAERPAGAPPLPLLSKRGWRAALGKAAPRRSSALPTQRRAGRQMQTPCRRAREERVKRSAPLGLTCSAGKSRPFSWQRHRRLRLYPEPPAGLSAVRGCAGSSGPEVTQRQRRCSERRGLENEAWGTRSSGAKRRPRPVPPEGTPSVEGRGNLRPGGGQGSAECGHKRGRSAAVEPHRSAVQRRRYSRSVSREIFSPSDVRVLPGSQRWAVRHSVLFPLLLPSAPFFSLTRSCTGK
ncbi:uncharacterized protein LOC104917184 [Meleagris gallopavo]|uniref:uncharacterized protein LOC104917184 n=1 Tax=Meleagris gallopavo TaxID=9103 RepID=UPI00093A2A0B|nr:uncharacterized protein LOC104917184 [Meleagris gallopavo]